MIGGGILVSFTASAGPRIDALGERRTEAAPGLAMVAAGSARAARGFSSTLEAPLADVLDWLVQPILADPKGKRERSGVQALMFADHPAFLPPQRLREEEAFSDPQLSAAGRFVMENIDGATAGAVAGDTGPSISGSGVTPVAQVAADGRTPDGATPVVPRAVSLASATPALAGPNIVAVKPRGGPAAAPGAAVAAIEPKKPAHPGYADLIDPEDMSKEQRCLAEAVYFEARSEPPAGQAAVAQVVLNRVKSGLYPDTVCGVVYQNRHRYLGCQFSFACEGKSLRVTEPGPWKQAVRIAREVTFGQTYLPKVGNATHYHADYVRPHWSRVFRKNDVIGRHIFYRPKPGQS